jgi:hypothetical protein
MNGDSSPGELAPTRSRQAPLPGDLADDRPISPGDPQNLALIGKSLASARGSGISRSILPPG